MKIERYLAAFAIAILLPSCSQEDEIVKQPAQDSVVEYTLNLQGDEFLYSIEPMSRGEADNGLYGINILQSVYEADGNKLTQGNLAYAYALVDNVDSPLKIGLIQCSNPMYEYHYTFECTYIPNAKDLTLIPGTSDYSYPYSLSYVSDDAEGCAMTVDNLGLFFKPSLQPDGSSKKFDALKDSRVFSFGPNCTHPYVAKFYGKTTIEKLDECDNSVSIDLYRRYFALSCSAEGLAEGERLEISLDDYLKYIIICTGEELYEYGYQRETDAEPVMDGVQKRDVTMRNAANSSYDQVPKDVNESVTLKVYFFRSSDAEGVEVMNKKQTFTRNYDYSIKFSDINRVGPQPAVSITVESTEMPSLNYDIPWSSKE